MQNASPTTSFKFTGRLRSFVHAGHGIVMILRSQHNAWVHAAATGGAIIAGILCGLTRIEWCGIMLAITVVWMAEALNTAFEFLCDVASPEFHPVVKQAKDVAAGAVLLSAIGSVIIGMLVFGPHLLERIR